MFTDICVMWNILNCEPRDGGEGERERERENGRERERKGRERQRVGD